MFRKKSTQEIKANLVNVDLSLLSTNESRAWHNNEGIPVNNQTEYELRIINKLLTQVSGSTKKSQYQRKKVELFKQYAQLHSFHFDRRFEYTSVVTASNIERRAVELDVYEIAHGCALILIKILYDIDRKFKAKEANYRAKKYLRIMKIELELRNFYTKISNQQQKKIILNSDLVDKIKRKSAKCLNLLAEIDSNKFQLLARLIISIATNKKSNYIEFIEDSLCYFKNKKTPFRPGVLMFSFMLCQSLINRDRFEDARILISSTIAESKIKDHNYYRLKEMRLKLALREFDTNTVNELIDFFYLKRGVVSKTILLRVSIYKMYAAIITGNAESARIKRTINKLHELSTDKQGVNLALIICELLINIARFNYDYIEDTHDSVNNYIKRHNLRFTKEAAFIKLIQSVRYIREHEKFETVAAERLHKMSLSVSLEPDLEIINYSDLWHFIMDSRIKMIDGRQIVV